MSKIQNSKMTEIQFRVGYRTLLSVNLPLEVDEYSLTRILEGDDVSTVPAGTPDDGAKGLFVHSQPDPEDGRRVSRVARYIRYVKWRYPRYYVDLSGDFDSYLATFSAKSRSTLTRKVRKFAKLSGGEIDWREYRSPAEMIEFHGLARRISADTYQERLLDAGLPDGADFIGKIRVLAERDAVRGYILFHEGRPVSYLYCPLEDGALVYRYLGYHPDYRRHSVGTVLQMLVLERLFAERRHRYFDFTKGEAIHKATFATDHRRCADVIYLRPTVGNICLICFHAALDSLNNWAIRALDGLGLKYHVKRWIRGMSVAKVRSA